VLAGRLDLAGAVLARVLGAEQREATREGLAGASSLSQASRLLSRYDTADLVLLLGESAGEVREWVRRELREARRMELTVKGRDLVAAGIAPGPALGRALAATRAARLDGEIGAGDEAAYALRLARDASDAAGARTE